MALTQSEMQSLLDKLRRARASGAQRVEHGDEKIFFKTDTEMASAIADLEARLAALTGTSRRGVKFIYQPRKGL